MRRRQRNPTGFGCPGFLWLLASFVLPGCIHDKPRPMAPAASGLELDARTLEDPALRQWIEQATGVQFTEWPPARWEMNALTLIAFHFHAELAVARAEWQVTRAEVIAAGGRPNPVISLTPARSFSPPSGVSPWLPGLAVDLPIETAGKRGLRQEHARLVSQAARWKLSAAAWRVRGALRGALVDWEDSRRRSSLLMNQEEAQRKLIGKLEGKVEQGAMAAVELLPLRTALLRIQADRLEAKAHSEVALAEVASVLGVKAAAISTERFAVDLPDPAPAELTTATAQRAALVTRADLGRGLAEYEAAEAALRLELAKQYPDIHFNPGYQWDQGEGKWTLGLSFEIPILNRNQGPIAVASARREEAAARVLAIQAKALADVDRTMAAYRAANERVTVIESWLLTLKARRDAIAIQVDAGAAEPVELLAAEVETAGGELEGLAADTRRRLALAALEDAVERPLDPHWIHALETDQDHAMGREKP